MHFLSLVKAILQLQVTQLLQSLYGARFSLLRVRNQLFGMSDFPENTFTAISLLGFEWQLGTCYLWYFQSFDISKGRVLDTISIHERVLYAPGMFWEHSSGARYLPDVHMALHNSEQLQDFLGAVLYARYWRAGIKGSHNWLHTAIGTKQLKGVNK